jgi:ubiquinone/menaquinone biosynthesis C-methylase UbiE
MKDQYTHGHHESVLRSHRWRTAENSAGFLLGHLRGGERILDVGCGPGTISADLARRVLPGEVTAVDLAPDVVELASTLHPFEEHPNLRFAVEDVYGLSFADDSFDVVYAHQVLQHLSDPVTALVEMRRVARPGALIAVRDVDFGACVWWPEDERLDRWLTLYHEVTRANRAQADAGRRLASWVRAAGLVDLEVTSSNWTFTSEAERRWWGQLWADRIRHSAFAEQALAFGLATTSDLEDLADGFIAWAQQPDGLFIVVHGEVVGRA